MVLEEFPVLAWRWFEPCVVDGGLVEYAFELVGLQILLEDAGGVDFGVGLCCIAACVLQDNCRRICQFCLIINEPSIISYLLIQLDARRESR